LVLISQAKNKLHGCRNFITFCNTCSVKQDTSTCNLKLCVSIYVWLQTYNNKIELPINI
jgi:hypothetical protein